MFFKITDLTISILTFVTTVIYLYFTYLITRDIYEPSVSFTFNQIKLSYLGFSMTNKSKVEVEVFGKLWSKLGNELFQFKGGFYGNGHSWVLQPFTEGHGHFELKEITNRNGVKLGDFLGNQKIPRLEFTFQIKYRKTGSRMWKISSPQNFVYNFEENLFWLNV